MATLTFQITNKDLAGLLKSLFDLGSEPKVQVMVHLRRRPRQTDLPINLVWEVEIMSDNGGVYGLLLGGDKEEDTRQNRS
jgi:hypothetical protein